MARDLLAACTWPLAGLGDALSTLARASGLVSAAVTGETPPSGLGALPETLARWIEGTAATLGMQAEMQPVSYGSMEEALRGSAPALVRLPGEGEARFLALLGAGRQSVKLLGTDRRSHRVPLHAVRAALGRDIEGGLGADTDQLLAEIGVSARRVPRTRAALLHERLGEERIGGWWRFRLPPGAGFRLQLRAERLPRHLAALCSAHLAQYLLFMLAWWVLGWGALEGRLDRGVLLAWALLLLTVVPLRLLATWEQGLVAIGAGTLLKKRLLAGALKMDLDEVRHQGAGQLLGRVIESQWVETLALSGGFLALVAVIELAVSGVVLALGAGGGLHALLLGLWIAGCAAIAWRYFRHSARWAATRLQMTHDLVERMVGHRTRLAQERPERWHDGEDQMLEQYLEVSRGMDRSGALLMALVPRGWLVVGFLGLAPAFVSGSSSPAALAVGFGGLLVSFRALKRLAAGLWQLIGAAIAWKQVKPLFDAAARPEVHGSPGFACAPPSENDGGSVLQAADLVFRYRDRGEPVLRGCSIEVRKGDRLLLEGPSGGGKSTLAACLSGLRLPESGLLLLHGLDRHTLGAEGWRRRIATVPQFHENHVLTGTFLFNALMGRPWPTDNDDIAEMQAVCREMGLEDLLRRMPGGILQPVGESGWQLSHGEQSRLFLARALLQKAEVIVVDESFSALDPENLSRALECVMRRSQSLLVIAHR